MIKHLLLLSAVGLLLAGCKKEEVDIPANPNYSFFFGTTEPNIKITPFQETDELKINYSIPASKTIRLTDDKRYSLQFSINRNKWGNQASINVRPNGGTEIWMEEVSDSIWQYQRLRDSVNYEYVQFNKNSNHQVPSTAEHFRLLAISPVSYPLSGSAGQSPKEPVPSTKWGKELTYFFSHTAGRHYETPDVLTYIDLQSQWDYDEFQYLGFRIPAENGYRYGWIKLAIETQPMVVKFEQLALER
ncbi:hypothetical protein KFE98_00130 [bacterium SCSIO 12741]|nr:hypothetical protein KFE98_00130 [bacterium SCSIO 12741]